MSKTKWYATRYHWEAAFRHPLHEPVSINILKDTDWAKCDESGILFHDPDRQLLEHYVEGSQLIVLDHKTVFRLERSPQYHVLYQHEILVQYFSPSVMLHSGTFRKRLQEPGMRCQHFKDFVKIVSESA